LILANTGIRHGTDADHLRWKHITLFEEKGDVFMEMNVRGKMGRGDHFSLVKLLCERFRHSLSPCIA
jgi:hypothetical protein